MHDSSVPVSFLAQVLRAFLKPKTKQNKPMSEMEVWDHVDIMEEEVRKRVCGAREVSGLNERFFSFNPGN